ncbi:LacI family DNA-binding transcriptional regulator [Ruania halotolerans]|uniref:LacI family DNA-binding transcriptional regulator n=1 Tax=Ruania halotolerans TaxID=2897773 RepID=UPI001E53DE15|nr:LacI family DNA-binding transcriptional regulator [Ruania halotolerans]UFU04912.1 LacI family transcriptional regulator [Ruania halotolerans]
MSGRTRLTDLAEHAGVSTATVSRVLNGKAGVSHATRGSVLAALDMLGYERPEKVRRRSAGLIGLVVPELTNPVFPNFAQKIESALAHAGYTPLLCTQSPGGITEDEYVEMLLEHGVDGIIFVSGLHADTQVTKDRYHRIVGLGTPIVLVNGFAGELDAPFISSDDVASMDLAVRHLASQGHTRIGLAVGPERFMPAARKVAGFTQALLERLDVTEAKPHIATSLYTLEGGQAAATQLLDRGHTAIVCASDLMALGAIRAARARGLSVPEDVSVIGYDDSPLIAFTDPPLTTIRQSVDAMSTAAVTSLLAEISGQPAPRTELLFTPELIVRGSTAACPS